MSTGLVVVASRGRCCAEPAARLGRQRLDAQPGRLARVGARDPGAAGVRHDADPVPRRQRLAGQQRGDVEQLADGAGADHAGVPEQRVDRRVRRGEQRARVRHRGPRPGRRAAALDRDHRLAGGHAASDLPEPARVAERLQVQPDHVGRRRRSPRTAAGRCRTGRPCSRSRRTRTGRARGAPPRRSPRSRTRRSGTRTRRRPAAARPARRWRSAPTSSAVLSTPRQFGPTSRIPLARQTSRSSAWRSRPRDPTSAKPAERTTRARHAGSPAFARDLHDGRGRDRDHRQLDGLGYLGDRAMRRHAADHVLARVHDREAAGVAGRAKVAQHRRADRPCAVRYADHGHRRGAQHVRHGRRGGDVVALLEPGARLLAELRPGTRPRSSPGMRLGPRRRSRSRGTPGSSGGCPGAPRR